MYQKEIDAAKVKPQEGKDALNGDQTQGKITSIIEFRQSKQKIATPVNNYNAG